MRQRKKRPLHRIAVVEEAADNIYSIRFILQSLGYDVLSFSASPGYLKALWGFGPRLVVVDMMMPGGEAYHIIRELKASPVREVPILAITADAMEGSEKQVYEAGGQDILAKPYAVGQLQEKLEHWLSASGEPADGP